MPHSPGESMWLYGIHGAGGEQLMLDAGKPGWIVCSEFIGHDPEDLSGRDFLRYRLHKLGVICRLSNGRFPQGTIPPRARHEDFARRCANFVSASPGCSIWIIGNEPNRAYERPQLTASVRAGQSGRQDDATSAGGRKRAIWGGIDAAARSLAAAWTGRRSTILTRPAAGHAPEGRGAPERFSSLWPSHGMRSAKGEAATGEILTPALYARCYAQCRAAIRSLPGHGDDQVLVAAVAPWNDQTRYAGNEWGDWVLYLRDVLALLGMQGCDGFALHCHTHQADPRLIESASTMGAPFSGRHVEFRVYRDFLSAVPQDMRHLPVYITEADPTVAWPEQNTGWIRRAYDEIAGWNRSPGAQTIRCLALYHWDSGDRWRIQDKPGTLNDFRMALRGDHRWRLPAAEMWQRGDRAVTLASAALHALPRRGDGQGENGEGELQAYSLIEMVDGRPVRADGRIWRAVREIWQGDEPRQGWIPQYGERDEPLIVRLTRSDADAADQDGSPIRPGDSVRTLDWVRMRLTPGYVGKPAEDVVTDIAPGVLLAVTGGPQAADGLTWWLLRPQSGPEAAYAGWMAEYAPDGLRLLAREDGSPQPEKARFRPGDAAETLAYVRLRRSPGFVDKPEDDVIVDIWPGTPVTIIRGPSTADELAWWEVQAKTDAGQDVRGWMAEASPEGIPLLGVRTLSPPPDFAVGELATVGTVPVRARREPGYLLKPENDVLGEFRVRATLVIQGGPVCSDGLVWWRAGGIAAWGSELVGWTAQTTLGGVLLVGRPAPLPGTDMPNFQTGAFLGMPFTGNFGVGQLWGENPAFYRRFSYDGAPLFGHNGIDFLTPLGTPLLATDAGTVLTTGFEPGGFGHFVLLAHTWGESIYAHMERIVVVEGQHIARGQRIGVSGNSGGSTGPHLHFAIRIHPYERADGWGGYSDPLPYLNPDGVIVPEYVLDEELRIVRTEDERASLRLEPSPMIDDQPGLIRP